MDYDEYLELHSRLGALLIGPQDKVLQRRLADEDWKEDTGGGYVNVKGCLGIHTDTLVRKSVSTNWYQLVNKSSGAPVSPSSISASQH